MVISNMIEHPDHAAAILGADMTYPILLERNGRIVDGMHRLCRAFLEKYDTISAVVVPPSIMSLACVAGQQASGRPAIQW
jgi:hypothetical protein